MSPSTEGTQLIKKSDAQTRVCTVQFSPDKESSLVHTADPVLLTSGCDGQSQTFSEFLDKFQQNNVSETELVCNKPPALVQCRVRCVHALVA